MESHLTPVAFKSLGLKYETKFKANLVYPVIFGQGARVVVGGRVLMVVLGVVLVVVVGVVVDAVDVDVGGTGKKIWEVGRE